MKKLIRIVKDEHRVSHRVIAENTNNKILSLQKMITDNISDFEEFGVLHVKVKKIQTKGGMQKAKTFYLNEQQATLLMTYLRNSIIVREFKKALVREFYNMRNQPQSLSIQLQRENIELKRTLNRLLSQELDTNVEKLKEQNTFYYENWQNAQANLYKLKNIFENI